MYIFFFYSGACIIYIRIFKMYKAFYVMLLEVKENKLFFDNFFFFSLVCAEYKWRLFIKFFFSYIFGCLLYKSRKCMRDGEYLYLWIQSKHETWKIPLGILLTLLEIFLAVFMGFFLICFVCFFFLFLQFT